MTIGTKAGKLLLLEDAELKQTIDLLSLIESSDISATNGILEIVIVTYKYFNVSDDFMMFVRTFKTDQYPVIYCVFGSESLSSKEVAETKSGSSAGQDKREISALITFKGGLVCSFGNGKVIVIQVQSSKDDEDIRFKVTDIIKLPTRNATTAGLIIRLI